MVNMKSYQMFNTVDRTLAIIAALPLFLYGLLIGCIALFLFMIGRPPTPLQITDIAQASVWHNSAIIVGAIALSVLILAAIFAFKNRLATWSYTWLGALLTGFIITLFLVGEDRDFMISKPIDIAVLTLAALSCLVIFCSVALKGWRHTGLLSMGFCGTLGLSLLFFQVFRPFLLYLCPVSILHGLMYAILVYVYVRSHSDTARIALIIGLAFSNIGESWIIEAISRYYNPSRDISQFRNLIVLLTVPLLFGTLSGIPGQFIRQKFGLLKRN
jgi:hypothetical protein